MILQILGGGPGQLSAIRRCRAVGIKSFVTDMDINAPGCTAADYAAEASTFDSGQTFRAAESFQRRTGLKIDALLVTGTDQPVLTAAETAERLGIPYFLDSRQAFNVTNKKAMKQHLSEAGIAVAPYRIIGQGFKDTELNGLKFPAVTKPLDSQGQRGVYRFESIQDIRNNYSDIISYSRCREILVEEYYPSNEITLSGWLTGGRLHVLSVTDRVTVDNAPGIGVCVAHHFPSVYTSLMPEIRSITERAAEAFDLKDGPLYFQYLVGAGGILVNEIACRLGGAYEDEFLPYINGIDILDVMIRFSCRRGYEPSVFDALRPSGAVSLQMFFCRPGKIAVQHGMKEVLGLKGVTGGMFLLKPGTIVHERLNSTQRAGYFIVCGRDKDEIDRTIEHAYRILRIENAGGQNLIQFYDRMLFRNYQ